MRIPARLFLENDHLSCADSHRWHPLSAAKRTWRTATEGLVRVGCASPGHRRLQDSGGRGKIRTRRQRRSLAHPTSGSHSQYLPLLTFLFVLCLHDSSSSIQWIQAVP